MAEGELSQGQKEIRAAITTAHEMIEVCRFHGGGWEGESRVQFDAAIDKELVGALGKAMGNRKWISGAEMPFFLADVLARCKTLLGDKVLEGV